MTALDDLSLFCCSNLRTLPASIMHLERLQKLWISESPLEDMPCIEALTLPELHLRVAEYEQGSRAFTALSCSLPCLQQLQLLQLRASDEDVNGNPYCVAVQAGTCLPPALRSRPGPCPLSTASRSMMIMQRKNSPEHVQASAGAPDED